MHPLVRPHDDLLLAHEWVKKFTLVGPMVPTMTPHCDRAYGASAFHCQRLQLYKGPLLRYERGATHGTLLAYFR